MTNQTTSDRDRRDRVRRTSTIFAGGDPAPELAATMAAAADTSSTTSCDPGTAPSTSVDCGGSFG